MTTFIQLTKEMFFSNLTQEQFNTLYLVSNEEVNNYDDERINDKSWNNLFTLELMKKAQSTTTAILQQQDFEEWFAENNSK